MPFDWKTPYGYLIALSLESIVSFTVGSIVIEQISFFIGSNFFIAYFVNDIVAEMPRLNVHKRSDGKNIELKKHLFNIIDDISEAKQLSKSLRPENDTQHFGNLAALIDQNSCVLFSSTDRVLSRY